jgi:O-antigen ligase
MGLAERIGVRNLPWVALVAALCATLGVTSGVQPKLGFEAAIGLAFSVAVLSNLTLGLALFTTLSFLEVITAGGPALSLMKVAGLLLFVSWFVRSATQREWPGSLFERQPLLVSSVIALVGWSAISLAWATSRGAAVTGTERFLLNALLLPIVYGTIQRRKQVLWIIGAFLLGATVSALWGLLQSAGPVGRLTGSIGDPNQQAAALVAGMMLAVGLAAALPRRSNLRAWAIAAGVVCGFGFVNTVSRGGLVALGCAIVAGILFGGRWRSRAVLFGVIGAASIGLYFSVLAPLAEQQHLSSTSSTGRTDLWKVGLKMFAANPLFGVGEGNFQAAEVHYVEQSGPLTRADLIVDTPKVTHNQYLNVLDELGIPGLLFFLGVVGASLGAAVRAAGRYEQAGDVGFEVISRMLVLAIVGVLAADVFISDQYSKQLWLLLALPAPLLALAPNGRE